MGSTVEGTAADRGLSVACQTIAKDLKLKFSWKWRQEAWDWNQTWGGSDTEFKSAFFAASKSLYVQHGHVSAAALCKQHYNYSRFLNNTITNIIHVKYCCGRAHTYNRFGTALCACRSKTKTIRRLLKTEFQATYLKRTLSKEGKNERRGCSFVSYRGDCRQVRDAHYWQKNAQKSNYLKVNLKQNLNIVLEK